MMYRLQILGKKKSPKSIVILMDDTKAKAETNERHRQLQLATKNKRQQEYNAQQSSDKKRRLKASIVFP